MRLMLAAQYEHITILRALRFTVLLQWMLDLRGNTA